MSFPRTARGASSTALALFAVLGLTGTALAQASPVPSLKVKQSFDTGFISNDTGSGPRTIAAFNIFEERASWMRVYFEDVQLSGNVALGTSTVIRITSLKDGYQQILDAKSIVEWSQSTAYFNGDSLCVEVVGGPETRRNHSESTLFPPSL